MLDFGKRALNKAQTRLNIMNAVVHLCADVHFRDLKVKAIIDDAGITEMTFFNYFPKKEDVLKYMMGMRELDQLVLQLREPLTGADGIRRIFAHTAEQAMQNPRLIKNLVAAILTGEVDPNAIEIEAADRYLLYPDLQELYEMQIPSGNEMLTKHILEMNPGADPMPMLMRLASCFYGDMVLAFTAGLDLGTLYEHSLQEILGNC